MLRRSNKTRARHRFVAHWLLLALLQQAMFTTGTMAGSAADGNGWVMLCTGSSDVAQLVYIGDSDSHVSHSQPEQCAFSAGTLAYSFAPVLFLDLDLYTPTFTDYSDRLSKTSRHFKLPRAPPSLLV